MHNGWAAKPKKYKEVKRHLWCHWSNECCVTIDYMDVEIQYENTRHNHCHQWFWLWFKGELLFFLKKNPVNHSFGYDLKGSCIFFYKKKTCQPLFWLWFKGKLHCFFFKGELLFFQKKSCQPLFWLWFKGSCIFLKKNLSTIVLVMI